jgi:hypothetical protein
MGRKGGKKKKKRASITPLNDGENEQVVLHVNNVLEVEMLFVEL